MTVPDLSNIYWIGGAPCSGKSTLSQCADPQAAFENWMERDARFGEEVSQKARQMGLPVIQVDGRLSIEENAALVEKALNLAG